jgi:leucyl-tRNA synthetase
MKYRKIRSRYGKLFILFAAPPEKQLDWSDDGLKAAGDL